MKVFLQFVVMAGLVLWLAAISLGVASNCFIKDMVELHGSQLVGAAVKVENVSISRQEKKLLLYSMCFSGAENSQALCVGSTAVQLMPDFVVEWRRASLMPDLLAADSLEAKDISVFYDIDSEGENLGKLKLQLSEMSSIAMRDRLNANAQGAAAPLLLQVKTFKVSRIKVQARSHKNPDRAKDFSVRDLVLTDLGLQENGVTSAEILEQAVRAVVDSMQKEAQKQGLVAMPSSEDGKFSRKRAAAKKDERDAESDEESGAGKTVRSIGTGLKKAGADIWQGTKKLFD